MNIKSEHIQVYPTAFRETSSSSGLAYNPESRLNTEFNVTNGMRSLLGDSYLSQGSKSGSFVVSWDSPSMTIIFFIHGYYFKAVLSSSEYSSLFNLSSGDLTDPNKGTIWATIKILPYTNDEHNNTSYKAFTLVSPSQSGSTAVSRPLDVEVSGVSRFEGIVIERGAQPQSSSTTYSLALLSKTWNGSSWTGDWDVPSSSRIILASRSVKDSASGKPITEEFTTAKLSVLGIKPASGSVGIAVDSSGVVGSIDLSVSSPSASGNAISFIDAVSEDSTGKISATKKTVRDASASQSGVVSTGEQSFAGNKTFTGTLTNSGASTKPSSGNYGMVINKDGLINGQDQSVSSPSTSGTDISFIDTVSQGADGKISATKKTVRSASSSQSGVVSTGSQTFAGDKTFSGEVSLMGGAEVDSTMSFVNSGKFIVSGFYFNGATTDISYIKHDLYCPFGYGAGVSSSASGYSAIALPVSYYSDSVAIELYTDSFSYSPAPGATTRALSSPQGFYLVQEYRYKLLKEQGYIIIQGDGSGSGLHVSLNGLSRGSGGTLGVTRLSTFDSSYPSNFKWLKLWLDSISYAYHGSSVCWLFKYEMKQVGSSTVLSGDFAVKKEDVEAYLGGNSNVCMLLGGSGLSKVNMVSPQPDLDLSLNDTKKFIRCNFDRSGIN